MLRHRIIWALLLCAHLIGPARAEPLVAPPSFWADIWGNGSYLSTNFESNFAQGSRLPLLARFDGKMGIRLPLASNLLVMPYGTLQGVASRDKNYWNNNYATGFGVRIMPLIDFRPSEPSMEWVPDTRIFWERLNLQYLKSAELATYEATNDERFGIEIWHEWNEPQTWKGARPVDLRQPWVEIWGNLSRRETNFSSQPFQTTLGFLQSKYGLYVQGMGPGMILEPYIKLDLVMSGKTNYWQNIVSPGIGVRMHLFRFSRKGLGAFDPVNKLRIFAEISTISYLKDRPPAGVPSTDFRVGAELAYGR